MLERKIQIGNRTLNNRLVMAPTDLQLSNHGTVTERLLDYYDSRTQGGYVGLCVVEHSCVQESGRASRNQLSCNKEDDIAGLTELAKTIHKNNTIAIMQLSHAGAAIPVDVVHTEGQSPSGIMTHYGCQRTHAMSQAEIEQLIEDFTVSAVRVKKAGFDGLELHSAHGYLLSQFYSPLTNRRTDAYSGQTLEGRLKLHLRLIEAVRKVLGSDMILGIRFGACDYMDGGSTIPEAGRAAEMLQAAGAHFIGVSGGMCGAALPENSEAGYFGDASECVKAHVSIPVILTGGIRTREDAERLLAEGKADLIGAARPFMRDATWASIIMR